VIFVLDQTISSAHSTRNEIVPVHLRDPLIVAGRTLAPAGAPASIRILDASPADIGDVYGFVDIYFEPLKLTDGRELPLHAPTSRLTMNVTVGHEDTVATEDTIGDIFIPYHTIYHAFRKGKNFVLPPGSEIRARTSATVEQLANGTVAIETPKPLAGDFQTPKATFPVEPAATPFGPAATEDGGRHRAHHLPSPSPSPSPSTSPTVSPSSSPAASASPSPTGKGRS
jgi:hypothetical protein